MVGLACLHFRDLGGLFSTMTDSHAQHSEGPEAIDIELYHYVQASLDREEIFHVLGFEFLHRYNLVQIQSKLIKIRERIRADLRENCDQDNLNDLLSEYSTCIFTRCEYV